MTDVKKKRYVNLTFVNVLMCRPKEGKLAVYHPHLGVTHMSVVCSTLTAGGPYEMLDCELYPIAR